MLSKETLELMAIKFVLELIVYESLSHQLADDHFDLSFLLKEPVVLAYLNLVILHQLEKLAFLGTLLCNRPIAFYEPSALSFNLLLGRRLV